MFAVACCSHVVANWYRLCGHLEHCEQVYNDLVSILEAASSKPTSTDPSLADMCRPGGHSSNRGIGDRKIRKAFFLGTHMPHGTGIFTCMNGLY